MIGFSQKRKSPAFGKKQYVVRIVEHRFEFALSYINCYRNFSIGIIPHLIKFIYFCVCCGLIIVNVKEIVKYFVVNL